MTDELVLHEATFRALGSSCRIVSDVQSAVTAAVHRLEDLEDRWSRFRPNSEISRLNDSAGSPVDVSDVTQLLIRRAAEAHHLTDGSFDPLLLAELVSMGYDRSYERLERSSEQLRPEQRAIRHGSAVDDIVVEGGTVTIPSGCGFDPGGIGKGLAADLLAEDLLEAGSRWVLVSLGGDMVLAGDAIAERGIDIVIEDPWHRSGPYGTVRVHQGAVATSSTRSRRWSHNGRAQHHLIDPRLGRASRSPRAAATVHAPVAWMADVLAKTVVLNEAFDATKLGRFGARGIAFDAAGHIDLGLELQPSTSQQGVGAA